MSIEDATDAFPEFILALRDLVEFLERVLAEILRENVRRFDVVVLDRLRPEIREKRFFRIALLWMAVRQKIEVGRVVSILWLATTNEREERIHSRDGPLLATDSGAMARRERACAASIDGLQHSDIDALPFLVSVLLVVLVDLRS